MGQKQRATTYGQRGQKQATNNVRTGTAKAIAGFGVGAVGLVGAAASAIRGDLITTMAGMSAVSLGGNMVKSGAEQGMQGYRQRLKTSGMEGMISKGQGKSAALGMRGVEWRMPTNQQSQGGRLAPGQAQQFQRANQNYQAPSQQQPAGDGKKKGWGNKARANSAAARGAKWEGPTE